MRSLLLLLYSAAILPINTILTFVLTLLCLLQFQLQEPVPAGICSIPYTSVQSTLRSLCLHCPCLVARAVVLSEALGNLVARVQHHHWCCRYKTHFIRKNGVADGR